MTAILHAPRIKDLQRALDRASKEFRARHWSSQNTGHGHYFITLYDGDGMVVAEVTSQPDPRSTK